MKDPYENIRSLIYEGSLYNHIIIEEKDFFLKLKNPTNQDLDWVSEFSPTQMWKKEIGLLAKSIDSVNGRMISQNCFFDLVGLFCTLNSASINRLTSLVYRMMDKAKEAHEYLEAYCYESESRVLWNMWTANKNFGYSPVSNQTKLNEIQTSWVNWNLAEDVRNSTRLQWDQALLITSSMNHKGAKEIGAKWESNDKKEEEYREEIKKKAKEGTLNSENIKNLRGKLDTFDDLKEEMRKWVAGEEDEHDRIVREYKESMYKKIEDGKKRAEKIRRENRERIQDLSNLNTSNYRNNPIVALTDEEVKKMVGQPKKFKINDEHEERFEHVKERYITARESSGSLQIDSEGKLVDVKKQKRNLMSDLKNRKTVL